MPSGDYHTGPLKWAPTAIPSHRLGYVAPTLVEHRTDAETDFLGEARPRTIDPDRLSLRNEELAHQRVPTGRPVEPGPDRWNLRQALRDHLHGSTPQNRVDVPVGRPAVLGHGPSPQYDEMPPPLPGEGQERRASRKQG